MIVLLVGAAPTGSPALVGALAEHCDLVIGVDGGAALCMAAGVTPDLVVGDLDSLDPAAVARLGTHDVPIQRHPAEKDESDLELAVRRARDEGARRLALTGILGGRMDHSLAALGVVARALDLRPIVTETECSVAIAGDDGASGCHVGADGTVFSVVALDGECTVSITGARWPLDHVELQPMGALGISNVVEGGSAAIHVHSGAALVIVPTDGGASAALEYDD